MITSIQSTPPFQIGDIINIENKKLIITSILQEIILDNGQYIITSTIFTESLTPTTISKDTN